MKDQGGTEKTEYNQKETSFIRSQIELIFEGLTI